MADNKDPHAKAELQRAEFNRDNPTAEASTFTQSYARKSWETDEGYKQRVDAAVEKAQQRAQEPQRDRSKGPDYSR